MPLPEAKRVPLLLILPQTDFDEQFLFREQIAHLLEELTSHPDIPVSYRDLARIFPCQVGSIDFQIKDLTGTIRPNGRPRLLTPEAYQMLISIVYMIEQIQHFFAIDVSLTTIAHMVK
jgi:hypothetical protein